MIELHAPIKKYLPFSKENIGNVSSYQLAGHTSGVRHYHYNEFINQNEYENVINTLEIFINDSLLSIPGTQYAYSSFGYNVLGAVIQSVSGKEFRSSIRETVLLPLGMNSTIADSENTSDSLFVSLYSTNPKGEIEPAAKTNLSDRWPSGGGVSSADAERIFQPFFRGGRERAGQRSGSGLGLAIAHEIAHQHRGTLTLIASEGPGACFELRLPV